MKLSVTPKLIPASAAELPLDHNRVRYTIVPAAGLWPWVGKSMSYLINLASNLRWALPTQSSTVREGAKPFKFGSHPGGEDPPGHHSVQHWYGSSKGCP
ncbi:hypothetical protein DSO57_1033776 [Entomophthora muscae]|uniref:Uncharacterized protein n=1 Tax=Entomophthora muscae TaxID=34485 RepID=A0ACC2TB09_9FUNG|nr:hypothetical protein DSO57_1033776 [Entomophthora muscae]